MTTTVKNTDIKTCQAIGHNLLAAYHYAAKNSENEIRERLLKDYPNTVKEFDVSPFSWRNGVPGWDEAFNASTDPNDWDNDWREHTDFTTAEGVRRLVAWTDASKKNICRRAMRRDFQTTEINGEHYVNADWFKYQTPITQAAKEDVRLEQRYVEDAIKQMPQAIAINGKHYVPYLLAKVLKDKIVRDFCSKEYLIWLLNNIDYYAELYTPHDQGDDW